ncbi:hypothetical protein BDC45DRAFT_497759 [Circinella umbellata]|nr:hypothetical protein BDC45DRAFT_497759 [Circinella umbellata]
MPDGNYQDNHISNLLTSNDAWIHFLEENEHATKQGHHHLVIDASCRALESFIESRLLTLYQSRAMAYGKIGQFEKAISDVQTMIQLGPQQPHNYIFASEIYMMQGKMIQAMDILNKGLLLFSSSMTTTTTATHLLRLKLQGIKEQFKERHVDFIKSAPTEIMMQILNSFQDNTSDFLELLNVSKVWRDRILGCSRIWTRVTTQSLDVQKLDLLCKIMPKIGAFIKEMKYASGYSYTRVYPNFLQQMKKQHLSNLTSLTITARSIGFDEPIYKTIQTIGLQLVTLNLILFDDEDKDMMPYFLTILEQCPNILNLKYGGSGMFTDDEDDYLKIRPYHGLDKLFLQCSYLSHGALELVLRKCIRIRRLDLSAEVVEGGTDICKSIQEYGINLDAFCFNADDIPYRQELSLIKQEEKENYSKECDIVLLQQQRQDQQSNSSDSTTESSSSTTIAQNQYHLSYLRVADEIYWLPTLVPLLSSHCKTLVELDMPLRVLPGAEFSQQIRALGQISLPSLRKLSIREIQRTHRTVTEMIHQSNKLKTLCLSFTNEESAQYVLNSLALSLEQPQEQNKNNTIEELQIMGCNDKIYYYESGSQHILIDTTLVTLFEACHDNYIQETASLLLLRTIVLAGLDFSEFSSLGRPTVYFDALSLMATLPTIRCIRIIQVIILKPVLNHFARALQETGVLEELQLTNLEEGAVDDESIKRFGSIGSLKILSLGGLISITDNCLEYLGNNNNNNNSLQTLLITDCPFITQFGLRGLQGCVPHIVLSNN